MLTGSVVVFLSRNLQKAVSVLITLLLARLLGPEGVGVYGLLVAIPMFAATFGSLDLGTAHIHLRGHRRISVEGVLGNSLVAALLFGTASILLFTFLRPFLRLETVNPALMTLITLTFPVVILQAYLDYLWISEDRLATYGALLAMRFLTLPLFLIVGLQLPDPYVGVAAALVLNGLLSLCLTLLAIHRAFGLGPQFDLRHFSSAIRYGLRIQVGSIAQAVAYRLDYLLVNYFLGVTATGLYVAATNLAEAVWLLPSAIATALLPRVSGTDRAAARAVTARTCRIVLVTSLISGLAMFLAAGLLLRFLYGHAFAGAVVPMRVLLAGTVALSVQRILANYFIGQGRADWFQRTVVLAMVANVLLNLYLIPRAEWGITGAATASAVSYTASALLLSALFSRWTGCSMAELFLPQRSDIRDIFGRLERLRGRSRALHRPRAAR